MRISFREETLEGTNVERRELYTVTARAHTVITVVKSLV
jgi:hypothetical protein